ncbi:hypothetical protein DO73_1457 [Burkholderia pseudomallei]|nr:hypothetical protein DO73_1457 [Burkholderia pseudomallei]
MSSVIDFKSLLGFSERFANLAFEDLNNFHCRYAVQSALVGNPENSYKRKTDSGILTRLA